MSSTDNITADDTPTFAGSAEPGSTVDLFTASSSQIGSATADGGGHWSITASMLSDGSYSVHATATNGVGTSNPSGNLTVEVDTTPPDQPSIFGHPDDPTDETSATFTFGIGTAPIRPHHGSAGFVGASVASVETFACSLDASGFAPCTSPVVYTGLGLGSHGFEVKSVDEAGNGSSVSSFSWTIEGGDTTPPETTIDSGPEGPTNDPSPTFDYSSSEPGSTFECRLTADSQTPGPFSPCASDGQSYSDLTDGSYTFEVRATDAAGNTDETPASSTFTVDTVAPNPPMFDGNTSPPSGSDNNYPSIFGSAEPGSTVDMFTDDSCTAGPVASGPAADFSSSAGLTVHVGDNTQTTFWATATDAAGNGSDCSSENQTGGSVTYQEVSGSGGGPDPIVVTARWTSGPTDLDLHMVIPTGDEVAYYSRCQPPGECWASLDQDSVSVLPGYEDITVAAANTPNPGDFYAGDYSIGVQDYQCFGFAGSDVQVTIKKGATLLASYDISGAVGNASGGRWDLGSFHVAADGSVSGLLAGDGTFVDTCGGGFRASKAHDHAQGSTGNGNGNGVGSSRHTPQPQPSPQPHPSPAPSPSPSPSPSPAPSPTHAPPPPPPMRAGWIMVLPLAVLPLSRLRRRKR